MCLKGCEQVTAYYVSRKMTPEFDLNKVIVHVEGDVDPRGFKGLEETVPAHMQKVSQTDSGSASESLAGSNRSMLSNI